MGSRYKVAAATALSLAAAFLYACRADDTAGNSRAAADGVANSRTASGTAAMQAASAKPGPSVVSTPAEEARRVTVAELRKLVEEGRVAVYDTRAKAAYDAEHIKGSQWMMADEVETRFPELPKDKTLVFYCTWPSEHTSARAALIAKSKGLENSAALLGGLNAWKEAGLPTESNKPEQK